jgi:flagellar biosynthesis/type III secretory pathway chaperone
MTKEMIAAASVLADALAEENAALAALDLPRAASMLADKQRAVAGFLATRDAQGGAMQHAMIEPLVRRLQSLSQENRTLLERAIAVQGRVIGVIARAAAPTVPSAGYTARGATGYSTRPMAFALSARA